jgi:probable HAF family extracellular repeat protein
VWPYAVLWPPEGGVQTLGNDAAVAYSINDTGQVVGLGLFFPEPPAPPTEHAFFWTLNEGEYQMQDLGTLVGGVRSRAIDINDHGQIVGYIVDEGLLTSIFLLTPSNGGYEKEIIQVLSAGEFMPDGPCIAINNSGQIVGTVFSNSGPPRAFLREPGGGMQDLAEKLGATIAAAWDINDVGQIVGNVEIPHREPYAFRWTPSGIDTDGDGQYDVADPDDDNDGVVDIDDPSPLDPDSCGSSDGETCDDCSVGTDDFGPLPDNNPANDGPITMLMACVMPLILMMIMTV